MNRIQPRFPLDKHRSTETPFKISLLVNRLLSKSDRHFIKFLFLHIEIINDPVPLLIQRLSRLPVSFWENNPFQSIPMSFSSRKMNPVNVLCLMMKAKYPHFPLNKQNVVNNIFPLQSRPNKPRLIRSIVTKNFHNCCLSFFFHQTKKNSNQPCSLSLLSLCTKKNHRSMSIIAHLKSNSYESVVDFYTELSEWFHVDYNFP